MEGYVLIVTDVLPIAGRRGKERCIKENLPVFVKSTLEKEKLLRVT